jgi:mRNA interferase YafQ
MYRLRKSKKFEKSYQKIKRSGKLKKEVEKDLYKAINTLLKKEKLQENFKAHQLKGELREYRECHIRGDLLLVYKIIEDELILILVDIGSHSYLNL